jgi:hypothetical protein
MLDTMSNKMQWIVAGIVVAAALVGWFVLADYRPAPVVFLVLGLALAERWSWRDRCAGSR